MPEPITVALIAAISSAVVALINYLPQRQQRKELREQRNDLKEVKEQVVNDHATAKYPNTRDELTSTRERVENLELTVEHIRDMVGVIAERLALTVRNRKDIEDTLSSRDELTDDRLEAAIRKHDLDVERLEAALREHPAACAAYRPVYVNPEETK